MKKFIKRSAIVSVIVFTFGLAGVVKAATTVNLGTADNFAILAGSTVTNTGSSVITGNLGLSPGTSVTGFPPGTLIGTQHVANATAVQAKTDLVTAYTTAAGQTPVTTVPTELGGTTKTAGVYNSASGTFGITGTVTLDAQNDPSAVFIFKTTSTLVTAGSSVVLLINEAQACNVFWQVGSSATLGANSTFKGNILALASATLTTGADVEGRVLARNGAVTLDTNDVTLAVCSTTATLHVIKKVTNTYGGTATVSSFNLHVKLAGVDVSGSPAAGVATPGRAYSLVAGTYVVSEDSYPSYTQSFSGDCDSSGSVVLEAGDDKDCTITNTDTPATLHVIKKVTNDNGGNATVSSFNLHVKLAGTNVSGSPAAGVATPGRAYSLVAGTYVVSEDSYPSYTQSFSGDCNSAGSVALAAGEDKTCTITNNDIAATLHVIKRVINDSGGGAVASGATVYVKNITDSGNVPGSPKPGVGSPGTSYNLNAGTYVVSEDAVPGYSSTFSGDCNSGGRITLAFGEDKTCTINNNDISPTSPILRVVKSVINNSGGKAIASSAMIHVKNAPDLRDVGGSPQIGVVSPGVDYILSVGNYVVVEDSLLGYSTTYGGDCDSNGQVMLSVGDDKTCTVLSDDIAPGFPSTGVSSGGRNNFRGFAMAVGILTALTFFASRKISTRTDLVGGYCEAQKKRRGQIQSFGFKLLLRRVFTTSLQETR